MAGLKVERGILPLFCCRAGFQACTTTTFVEGLNDGEILKPANPRTPKPIASRQQASLERLLSAILDDDRSAVADLLKKAPSLATALVEKATLYQSKILHWLYAHDTPLHLAAAGHRAEIVRILLAAGADPNASQNHRCSRPLHYAADGNPGSPSFAAPRQVKTIRYLLNAGADLHATDKNGATALHRAVRTRCAAATQCLLQAGADPTAKNLPGATPFHLAVQNTGRGGSGAPPAKTAQRKIIEIMLAHGVSPQRKDARGKSVLAWATTEWIRELLSPSPSK